MLAHPPIRQATLADLSALLELERRVFSGDRLSARQYQRHLTSKTAQVLIAGQLGQVLGNAVVFFRKGLDIARLYSIAVAPQAQGLRLGAVLLMAAENNARARGCTRMRLEVRQDNPAAIRLYEREGYHRFGARANYYEDGMAAWRYEKPLVKRRETR